MSVLHPESDSPPDLRERLHALRVEIESIASTLASVTLPVRPQEITEGGQRVWHDNGVARVHVIDNCVFISGRQYWMTWPDWTALRPGEARELGVALLAAAADLQPELEILEGGGAR